MNKLTLNIITSVTVVGSAFAGTEAKTFKDKVVVEPTCVFRDTEIQIDAFYSGSIGSKHSTLHTASGSGNVANIRGGVRFAF